ncbi:MAG: hypothetical protein Q8O76_02925, partial [Chloroflexota bacterium]|nr:hypothetical protein [Chloroflexota bacterium]
MTLYRLRFAMRVAYATPFLADTLCGHICWAALRTLGRAGLDELIGSARAGRPLLVLSDGFPGDLLPMPVLLPAPIPEGLGAQRVHYTQEKKRRQASWVTQEEFRRMLHGEYIVPAERSPEQEKQLPKGRGILKNTVNRLTSTTPDAEQGGGLYEFQETFQPQVTVYAQIAEDYLDTLRNLLVYLAETGYGKRKSIGYGAMASPPTLEPFPSFGGPSASEANAFVSLSTFVPAQGDPTDGSWQVLVKYGKLGEEFALGENPFKRPLLMLAAGSV